MPSRQYYVYILASLSRTLYVGVTNNLLRRVNQHQRKEIPGFTAKYNITRLVHYEVTSDIRAALAREKEVKGWHREKKIKLIEAHNPHWHDLSQEWVDSPPPVAE